MAIAKRITRTRARAARCLIPKPFALPVRTRHPPVPLSLVPRSVGEGQLSNEIDLY